MKPRENIATIYEAALGVFADFGYKKATLDDIAAELGMTKGNLYRYAQNKKDLYRNTVRHAMLRWQGRVREAIEREPDAEGQFQVMCRKAVAYLSEDDALRRLLHSALIFQSHALHFFYLASPDLLFGVDAPELKRNVMAVAMEDRELARQLKQLCRAMDPVKFAGKRVNEKQMEQDLFFVRGLVRQTTQSSDISDEMDSEKKKYNIKIQDLK